MNFGGENLQKIKSFADKNNLDFYEAMSVFMAASGCDLTKTPFRPDGCTYQYALALLQKERKIQWGKLKNAYRIILKDLQYFPILAPEKETKNWLVYENTWGEERTYGGERKHEGTDLIPKKNIAGYYPVLSMSDGTVENIGWLEQGGWRIGIRTPSGAYLYYAHLFSYFKEFKQGDSIKAGDILGYMGDSGYSKKEGTTGNFVVHLHLGIYMQTDLAKEMSVNPYAILKYLEKHKLRGNYQEEGADS